MIEEKYEVIDSKPPQKPKKLYFAKKNVFTISRPTKVSISISGTAYELLHEFCGKNKYSLSDGVNLLLTPKAIKELYANNERIALDNRLRTLEDQLAVIEKEKQNLLMKKRRIIESEGK